MGFILPVWCAGARYLETVQMYTATLEPLLRNCDQVIDMAKAGAIDEAREKLDGIRFLRSLIANKESEVDALDPSQRFSLAESHTPELLRTYAEVATSVNQRLELIQNWISESRRSFTTDELRQSFAGMNLFIDDALPPVWDFNHDIAVLTDADGEAIREVLRHRGHKKFIWITDTQRDGTDLVPGEEEGEDTVFVLAGEFPSKPQLESLLGRFATPRVALLTLVPDAADEQYFYTVVRAIGSSVIAGSTAKWLPQMTTEQWLAKAPQLAGLPSATSLRSEFEGADVLVVSPGPSLAADLALLESVQDRFLIFASVKALDALFDAGIKPDLAIWQDPRDHSDAIPDRPELANLGLVVGEGCHPAFYDAGFATYFPYPGPAFVGSALCSALHGDEPPLFIGTCVSTLSANMALEFGARSITLIGQDLSVGGGLYVKGGVATEDNTPDQEGLLTCMGIDGQELPTLPNYFAFIDEFQAIARVHKDRLPLINATACGAYLEGWEHVPFAEHALIKSEPVTTKKPDITARFDAVEHRSEVACDALRLMSDRLDHAARLCDEIQRECLEKIQSGSNDCTIIDLLEQRLKSIVEDECTVLKHYTSRQSMALNAATDSIQNLEQNLRVSADYYDSIAQAARHLITLCQEAIESMERAQEGAGA